jgi:hypothetical protein
LGTTVKVSVPPAAILDIEPGERVKLAAFVPKRVTESQPVGLVPVLVMVTVRGSISVSV